MLHLRNLMCTEESHRGTLLVIALVSQVSGGVNEQIEFLCSQAAPQWQGRWPFGKL